MPQLKLKVCGRRYDIFEETKTKDVSVP